MKTWRALHHRQTSPGWRRRQGERGGAPTPTVHRVVTIDATMTPCGFTADETEPPDWTPESEREAWNEKVRDFKDCQRCLRLIAQMEAKAGV